MKPQKFPTKVDQLGSHLDSSQGVRVENECWGDSTYNYAFIRLYILYTCLHKATQQHIHALAWHLYNIYNSIKVAYGPITPIWNPFPTQGETLTQHIPYEPLTLTRLSFPPKG